MTKFGLCVVTFLGIMLGGCAILKPVESKKFGDISAYKYAVIGQTQSPNSSAGSGYIGYGTGGGFMASVSKSVNPSDVIAGILMKKGFIVLDSVSDDVAKKAKTLLVRYGQGDSRSVLATDIVLDVTIQILDASSHDLLFTCSAEGAFGELRAVKVTEADALREAITRCLKDL